MTFSTVRSTSAYRSHGTILSAVLVLAMSSLMACSISPINTPSPQLTLAESLISNPDEPSSPIPERRPDILRVPTRPSLVNIFNDAPDRDLFRLTKELTPNKRDLRETVNEDTKALALGHSETFWLVDLSDNKIYQSDFELILIMPHSNWYVENGLQVQIDELKRSAEHFEEHIHPVINRAFGNELSTKLDNHRKLNVLNAKLSGVAGYFSSTDAYPKTVRPKSNEKKIIYINAQDVPPGTPRYAQVLSHELQHAIHWDADSSEDTWVNEGLSELASSIALDSTTSIHYFLRNGPVSLINWPTTPGDTHANYGAASLFMHFLTEHYGGRDNLRNLLNVPDDSIAGIDSYLEHLGYEERFADVFKQWAAANIIDNYLRVEDTFPGYVELKVKAKINETIEGLKENTFEIPQYGVSYIKLEPPSAPSLLSFQGDTHIPLLPTDVDATGCWWSNSGDSIDSTLELRIDLSGKPAPVLEYQIWFEIEENWDYLYVEVSTDRGETWLIATTPNTSHENPIGNSFGPGYTGSSGGWITESVELTEFSDKDIWVRFQYITDEALNASGACLRNLSVSGVNIATDDGNWKAQGFVFTNNLIPQGFQVQLITTGEELEVREMFLDASNNGTLTVHPLEKGRELVVAVGALAGKTRESTSYTLGLKPTE